jgi:transcriptional regulator with XRE-family HTH domain
VSLEEIRPTEPLLGREILRERLNAGSSALALAAAVGISRSYLCDIEKGRRVPGAAVIGRICNVLRLEGPYTKRRWLDLASRTNPSEVIELRSQLASALAKPGRQQKVIEAVQEMQSELAAEKGDIWTTQQVYDFCRPALSALAALEGKRE